MTDDPRAKAVGAAADALYRARTTFPGMTLGDEAQSAIAAYLATMAEAGWVMVPREPTEAMQAAGGEYQYGPDPLYRAYNAARTWAAMHRASEEG